jgi:hypothetical protein
MAIHRLFYSVLIVALPFLSTCLTVEEEIELNMDGSGKGKIVYIMPTGFYKGQVGAGQLNITEDSVRKDISGREGIDLEYVKTEMDEDNVKIVAAFSFENITLLSQRNIKYALDDMGDMIEFRVWIRPHGGKAKEIVKQFFESYVSKLKVDFPSKVLETNGKTEGRQKVRWEVPLSKLIGIREDIVLWARFSKKKSLIDRILNLW